MKKIWTVLIIALFSIFLTTPANASERSLVEDYAGILNVDEVTKLNAKANAISDKYGCDAVIFVIYEMTDNDGPMVWAMDIFDEFGYGYGSQRSGIMLFLSMAERDYAMIAHGYGNVAFTDHGKDVMLDKFILPLLKNDDYYGAFNAYLNKSEEFLRLAYEGAPFDINTDPDALFSSMIMKIAVVVLVPLIIAFVVCSIWKSQMQTARPAMAADNYIPKDGFILTAQSDMFLYRTRKSVKVQSSSSGGTTVNSRGYSGRSGKF